MSCRSSKNQTEHILNEQSGQQGGYFQHYAQPHYSYHPNMNNINNIIEDTYNELEINDFDFYNDFTNNFNN